MTVSDMGTMPVEEGETLLRELRVYHVELEMQNEELLMAHAAQESARARYFDLYDMAPVAYFTLSEKSMILEANFRAGAMLALSRGDLARQLFTRFIDSEDLGVYYLHRKKLFATGDAQAFELRMKRPSGGMFWARVDATVARHDTTGALLCRLAMSDITAQKHIEEQRSLLLAGELAARQKAEEALKQRDEFITAAAHNLRTPLGALLIQVEGMEKEMRRHPTDPSQTEQGMKLIERLARRMILLVNNLLHLSRYNSGRMELRRSPCDLVKIAREVCARHASELSRNGCDLELELEPSIAGLWDKEGIDQVIDNLLSNAIRFGRGKPIRIEAALEGGRARLTVASQGNDIPEEHLSRIFELYTRENPATQLAGLGIGLYIAQQIVTAHGGTLAAANRPGRWVVFTMNLPCE